MSVHSIYYKEGRKMMRAVNSREEYIALRNSETNRRADKLHMVQMNYSCLPNEDGSLRGSKRTSNTVGMDVDHIAAEEMTVVRERILSHKEELGLLMLEESARGAGYHLVFRRQADKSQEENLLWASELLGVEYDAGAKDITRVFFTPADKLLYLDDEVFAIAETEPIQTARTMTATAGTVAAAATDDASIHVGAAEDPCFKGIPY